MKVIQSSVIYENPLPQLRSRHSFFPFLSEQADGTITASIVIGEAFESVDSTSCMSVSRDGGVSWSKPQRMFGPVNKNDNITDYCKVTTLADGRQIALGYAFVRDNPELPIGNPENGGLLDDFVFWAESSDNGNTWSDMREIPCSWGRHTEASAPLLVMKDGTWITPITGFSDWAGKSHGRMCGRALRSEDQGKTWNDDTVCMAFPNDTVTCFEQRMCQLESGTILCIGWNEDIVTGERLDNHYTVSYDNGRTFTAPITTGVRGQASSVCALGGEKLLALHAVRRDTERPGIYGYVIDFSEKTWNVIDELLVWEPQTPMVKDVKMAEIFSFLKFGQPGSILLRDGDVMMSHWCAENGQYKTVATRIRL